jgi:predicted nucleic acid-binding protein
VRFVLDASLATACFFKDERSPFSDAVRATLPKVGAAVPLLWLYEVSNILHLGKIRERISEVDAASFVDQLLALPVSPVEQTGDEVLRDLRVIADSHALTSYDAAYVHLCLALALPLGTLDGTGKKTGLKQAAAKMGVEVLTLERVETWNIDG